MRAMHAPNTSNASFWIGPRWWGKKSVLRPVGGALDRVPNTFYVSAYTSTKCAHRCYGASCARGASAKRIFGAGDENAGAARLAPNALVARSRRTVIVA